MNKLLSLLRFLAFLVGLPIAAQSQITLAIVPHGLAEPPPVRVRLRPVTTPSSIDHSNAAEKIVDVRKQQNIELGGGYWAANVESPTLWHASQYFASDAPKTVSLDVWPLAGIVGKVVVPESDGKRPTELQLLFSRHDRSADVPENAMVKCPVEPSGSFRCGVPAGALDLRLHARGYLSLLFWNQKLQGARALELGTLNLKHGQSILGHVELPRGNTPELMQQVVVTATPAAMGEGDANLIAGGKLLPLSATPRSDGFFEIEGLAPGQFLLTATVSKPVSLISAPLKVMVQKGTEAELLHPIRLDVPRKLLVAVSPPADTNGERWHIKVQRFATDTYLVPVSSGSCSSSGIFEMASVQPGRYLVELGTVNGDVFASEHRTIDVDTRIDMHADLESIGGTVTFAKKPLAATLTFRDDKNRRVIAHSDEHGSYSTHLPNGGSGKWNILINSRQPSIWTTLRDREIPPSATEGTSVDLEVASTAVTGDVVDSSGVAVAGAIVTVTPTRGEEHAIQTFSEADGSFSFYGLDAGSCSVSASFRATQSEAVSVQVEDASDPGPPVHLVMKDIKRLPGIVVSELGPVAGAIVFVYPTDVPGAMVAPHITDANGAFEAWLPPTSRVFDVTVAAAGYSYMLDHLDYQEGKRLNAKLYQLGGTLSVPNTQSLQIVHGGGILAVGELTRDWSSHPDGDRVAIDMMEPGIYSLCNVESGAFAVFRATNGAAGGNCVSGFLPPQGTLSLEVKPSQHASN